MNRRRRIVMAAATALLALGAARWVPCAAATPAATAGALLHEIEMRFRGTPRIVQLDIETERPHREGVEEVLAGEPIRLIGAVNGDAQQTAILFVFTRPKRTRGTGLLIKDPAGSAPDSMWYHMRTFRRFLEIPQTSLKLLVPGTCLTYEDARGFLSADLYTFRDLTPPAGAARQPNQRLIEARPKTPALERDLGFNALRLTVDRQRLVLLHIDYLGAGGQLLKTYEMETAAQFGSIWLPSKARVNDLQGAITSVFTQRYWPLKQRLPDSLFEVEVEKETLLERFQAALGRVGVDVPE